MNCFKNRNEMHIHDESHAYKEICKEICTLNGWNESLKLYHIAIE